LKVKKLVEKVAVDPLNSPGQMDGGLEERRSEKRRGTLKVRNELKL